MMAREREDPLVSSSAAGSGGPGLAAADQAGGPEQQARREEAAGRTRFARTRFACPSVFMMSAKFASFLTAYELTKVKERVPHPPSGHVYVFSVSGLTKTHPYPNSIHEIPP
jgi:hypothetical protein